MSLHLLSLTNFTSARVSLASGSSVRKCNPAPVAADASTNLRLWLDVMRPSSPAPSAIPTSSTLTKKIQMESSPVSSIDC
jgi:hypothetical protein